MKPHNVLDLSNIPFSIKKKEKVVVSLDTIFEYRFPISLNSIRITMFKNTYTGYVYYDAVC